MSSRPSVMVEGSRAFYRASSSGMCSRALAGMRAGMDPLAPSEDQRRRFKDGHLHEASILEAVEEELGQSVVRRQEEWTIDISSKITIVGHVDGILSDDLIPVEAKSASRESFAKWEKGVEEWFSGEAYREGYADQWSLTLKAYDRTHGVYAVKNKDSGKVLLREIGIVKPFSEIRTRLMRIDLDGRRGMLPECDREDWSCPLRYLHEEKDRTPAEMDEGLEGLARAYREALEDQKRAEEVKKELGVRLASAMGEREKVETGTCLVAMVPWKRSTLDKNKLEEVVGDLTPFESVKTGVYVRVTERDGSE